MAKSAVPKISIITVCYNAAPFIERTIQSVLAQTHPAIEYLVIDGASTDQTMEIVCRYRNRISQVISEPDKGLYDAMNKGLRMATGDYVLFLNADDELFDDQVLEWVFATEADADVYYGDAALIDYQGKIIGLRSTYTPHKVPNHLHWKSLRWGMVVSHQAFIVKRSIAPPYDLQYKICADIDWMIRCLKKSKQICNTHLAISKFRVGGASKQQQKLAWKERFLILQRQYGGFSNLFNHAFIALRYLFSNKY